MKYGIYILRKITENEEIVRCNNCYHYYYDEITDERNNNSLKIFFDNDNEEFFKGCPVCETDNYLMDIDLSEFSEINLEEIQKDNGANFDEI
jgi:Pyruvate/2-oxoacid:ferredoxin oxidoreductase delta subunit